MSAIGDYFDEVRADRLVSLVLLLQARGPITARELAAELGVSVRTVYRDLAGLSAAGIPVLAEPGPGGGCRLLDGYRFPLRGLRPEEAEALLILGVPEALRELGLDAAAAAAHRQIRVTAGLDSGSSGHSDGSARAALVHLDMPRWFAGPQQVPFLRTLAQALRQQRQLELRYQRQAAAADLAPRVVAPLGLVNKAGTWYLVAMPRGDKPRGDKPPEEGQITVFRAGRITWAQMLAGPARRPEGFELARFWERWSQEFRASRPRLAVRLRACPQALAAFAEVFGDGAAAALSAAQPSGHDGWQELTLMFEHEAAATHRLAGFGAQIEVLAPVAVRERLLTVARDILERYDADRNAIP
jgi:predicted DNA-binding transcriptional regulator YafY